MIFLSHSWTNKSAARKIVEALATEGLPCWLDEQQLEDGAELRASLRLAISQSDVYLYLVSNAANESIKEYKTYYTCLGSVTGGFRLEEGSDVGGIFLQITQPGNNGRFEVLFFCDEGPADAVVFDVVPDEFIGV